MTSASCEEGHLVFRPPLYWQRAQLAVRTLERFGCRRVVDAGCSRGELLHFILNAASLQAWQPTDVTAIDIDHNVLAKAAALVPPAWAPTVLYSEDAHIRFFRGDLTTPPPPPTLTAAAATSSSFDTGAALPAAVDAVLSIEVIEHIPPHLVAAYTHTIFVGLGAARGASVALLTTPNRSENGRLHGSSAAADVNSVYRPWEDAPPRRHDEHYFELTRQQWHRYVAYVETCYGAYWCAAEEVLLGDGFTQGTLFVRRGTRAAAMRPTAKPKGASWALSLSPEKGRYHAAHRTTTDTVATPGSPSSTHAEHHDAAANDPLALLPSRDEVVVQFPFEAIFGMSRAAYDHHFLHGSSTADEENSLAMQPGPTYQLVESCVIPGKDLWHVLCDIVRRGNEERTVMRGTSDADARHSPRRRAGRPCSSTAAASLAFPRFYSAFLSPLLPMLLGGCTLEHLLCSALQLQRALWAAAVKEDWASWTRFLADGQRRHAVVRTSELRARDATRTPRETLESRMLTTVSTVPLTVHGSVADATLSALAASELATASSDLMHFIEEGRHRLCRAAGNATGLLLHTWVCGEVRRCRDTAQTSDASCAASTMAALPACVRWCLMFLASVDVLPAAWRALRDPASPQVVLALHRDTLHAEEGSGDACRRSVASARSRRRCARTPLGRRHRTHKMLSNKAESEARGAAASCPLWLRHYLAAPL